MAGENGQETSALKGSVLERLESNPFGFDFFHALRELENHFRDAPRFGKSIAPHEDPIRFGQKPELYFPPSTFESLDPATSHRPQKLSVRFLGLLGPNGPLPINYTEYTYERTRNARDSTLTSFYDIFHHRLVSLFYRAWAINQKAVDLDRPADARFPLYFGSFFGIADPSLCCRDSIPDEAKLYFTGRLSNQSRNAVSLECILSDFFGTPAEVESMVGHWLPLSERYFCRLGVSRESAVLGENAVLGETCWDMQNHFRVRLGPVKFARLLDFLPDRRSYRRLVDWIAFFTSEQFTWDARILLDRAEIPPTTLGGGSLLGWTTWLQSHPAEADSEDYVIEPSQRQQLHTN